MRKRKHKRAAGVSGVRPVRARVFMLVVAVCAVLGLTFLVVGRIWANETPGAVPYVVALVFAILSVALQLWLGRRPAGGLAPSARVRRARRRGR